MDGTTIIIMLMIAHWFLLVTLLFYFPLFHPMFFVCLKSAECGGSLLNSHLETSCLQTMWEATAMPADAYGRYGV